MGYTTSICISIVHQDRLNPKWEQAAFKKIMEEARMDAEPLTCNVGRDEADFNDHNDDATQTIIERSKRFPSLLMEACGTGEEGDDRWCMRIRNGQTETVTCQLVCPTFSELLTPKERKAARWKAVRRFKAGDATLYDRRVAKALRLLRDLQENPPKCNVHPENRYPKVDLSPAVELLERIKRGMC